MKVYDKKTFPRRTIDFVRMNREGNLSFDNAVQRNLIWDNDKKSLLIHSMIIDFPIPPLYCNCVFDDPKKKIYDFVDGKQRVLGTTIPYLSDEYVLTNVPIINLDENSKDDEDADPEKLIDINGLKFSELPEDFRDRVKNYSLTLYYYENMEQEDVEELFYRLNNGKPLSAIELTRVKAKSLDMIQKIAKHEIFKKALTEKAMQKYMNEDTAIKSWAILNTENPSFETKQIRPMLIDAEVTEEQANTITAVYNKILNVYTALVNTVEKQDAKIAKRILTRTHLVSIIPTVSNLIKNETWNTEQFTGWVRHFFAGTRSATISDRYNEAARNSSGKVESIRKRLEVIEEDFKGFVLNGKVQLKHDKQKQEEQDEEKQERILMLVQPEQQDVEAV